MIRSQLGSVYRSAVCALFCRKVVLGDLGPIVSFTFDDFPRTALTVGGVILENFGARATFYICMGLLGHHNEMGEHFGADDLKNLLKRGHEIGGHGFRHLDARSSMPWRFLRDMELSGTAINEALDGVKVQNFAYPYGAVTLMTKARIGAMARSCRGVYGGLNGPVVDLNLLRANGLFGGVGNSADVRALMIENEKKKGWLIFFSHDVAKTPSRFGCTPDLLEFAVSFAADRKMKIMTIGDVVNRICVSN